MDLRLDGDGDLYISPGADVELTGSVRQAVLIRLRWILGEWRLGPGLGFPWFEEVFVKNPNLPRLKNLIRQTCLSVDGVTDAQVLSVRYSREKRTCSFTFRVTTGKESYTEEVALSA